METSRIVAGGIEGLQVTGATVEDATAIALELEQRLEQQYTRRARTLSTGDAVSLLTRAIEYLASPVEAGAVLLTLELKLAGGTVARANGYPASADRLLVRAIPGTGVQAFWWRGHCGACAVSEQLLHPALGPRSRSRLEKPLGWRTKRGASSVCGLLENRPRWGGSPHLTRTRIVQLLDGSFAAVAEYGQECAPQVIGPDWSCALEQLETVGLFAPEGA